MEVISIWSGIRRRRTNCWGLRCFVGHHHDTNLALCTGLCSRPPEQLAGPLEPGARHSLRPCGVPITGSPKVQSTLRLADENEPPADETTCITMAGVCPNACTRAKLNISVKIFFIVSLFYQSTMLVVKNKNLTYNKIIGVKLNHFYIKVHFF